VIELLQSLRSLVFGETWIIPAGVGVALAAAFVLRATVPHSLWTHAGGFMLAVLAGATLALSLRLGR
jgi:hypothetical protein